MITMDFRTINSSTETKYFLERFGIIGSSMDIITNRKPNFLSQRYEKSENTYRRIRSSTGSNLIVCSFEM